VVAVEQLIKIESHARSRQGGVGSAGHSMRNSFPVGVSLLAIAI